MSIKSINDFITEITPIATFLILIIPITGALISFWRKNIEQRLSIKKSQAEIDIQLLKHFTELMDLANGRGRSEMSEVAIEKFLTNSPVITAYDTTNIDRRKEIREMIEDLSCFTMPVGQAAQHAAIAAIYVLATKHDTLKTPALQGLKALSFIDVAKTYYERLVKE
jgi:hypothetical protein